MTSAAGAGTARPGRLALRRNRTLSIQEGMSARSIFLLTGGAFLAGYARLLGADDGTAGLLGAVPVLMGLVSMASPILLERMRRRKAAIVAFNLLGRLAQAFPVAIPWIARTAGERLAWLIASYALSCALISFMMPAAAAWVVDSTPVAVRARYFARREAWCIGAATVASLGMGVVLDARKAAGDAAGGFTLLYATVLLLVVANTRSLLGMADIPKQGPLEPPRLRDPFVLPFADPRYRRLLAVVLLWSVGFQAGIPFTSVYLVSSDGLALGYVPATLFAAGTSLVSVLSARLWGKVADRSSWIALMRGMVLLQAAACVFWFLTDRTTAPFTLPLVALATGGMVSGMNMSLLNLQYGYAPESNRTVYMGTLSAVNGVAGFGGSLAGAAVLRALGGFSATLPLVGIGIGAMQAVFLLSAVLLAAAAGASALLFRRGEAAA